MPRGAPNERNYALSVGKALKAYKDAIPDASDELFQILTAFAFRFSAYREGPIFDPTVDPSDPANRIWSNVLLVTLDPEVVIRAITAYFDQSEDILTYPVGQSNLTVEAGRPVILHFIFHLGEQLVENSWPQIKARQWGKFFKTRHRKLKKTDQKLYLRVPHR